MRYAILAATVQGAKTAARVHLALAGEADIFLKAGRGQCAEAKTYDRLAPLVAQIFSRYDALIFIMATGIVVRVIAPLLENKLKDPAVLVLDERAQHVISLLSGHIGGANLLTLNLSRALHADPVLTTATDVEGKLAPDVVAARLFLMPTPKVRIKDLNQALLAGASIHYAVDKTLPQAKRCAQALQKLSLPVTIIEAADLSPTDWTVWISQNLRAEPKVLNLYPRPLVVGIGCRRGTTETELQSALQTALASLDLTLADVSRFASVDVKADEAGLLSLASHLGRDIHFYSPEVLEKTIQRYGLAESAFVKKTIGVGNVAEAAALADVRRGMLALPKCKFPHVTMAFVFEKEFLC